MEEVSLYHHGILGMKWGVRRYQNKDGTLTPAGKKHLAERTGNKESEQETKFDKDSVIAKGDYRAAIKNLEVFTNQELDTIIQRHGKEVALRDFEVKELKAIQDAENAKKQNKLNKYKRLGEVVQTTSNIATNTTSLYNSIAKASNALMGTELPIIGEKKDVTRGTDINKDIMFEPIAGNPDYMMKVTRITTKNSNGTTSHTYEREMVSKGGEKKDGGDSGNSGNGNGGKKSKSSGGSEKSNAPSKVKSDGTWKEHKYIDKIGDRYIYEEDKKAAKKGKSFFEYYSNYDVLNFR